MAHKILVVDDSIVARRQVIDAIKGDPDLQLIEAADGEQGLALFKANPDICLVISDVNMPVMDGLQMAKAILESSAGKVPVVMVTTESTPEQIAKGKACGIAGWMVKPFNPNHLQAAVKKALST